ncbi:MAG: hypothetical protein ACF8CQ_07650, partial [Rhodopirellula sp. JB044]|uniref:hypothetical protein n=1 Tax=Rhodopirellula sp. JB044 TaxID=3342844 RepID=UPI00370C8F1D
TYLVSYLGVNHLVAPAVAANSSTLMTGFLSVDVCLAFLALFLLNVVLMRKLRPSWLESLRIHAANGFYVDEIYRRAFGRIASS